MDKEINADFCIEIKYQKESENPERIFKTMYELIETFKNLDSELVKSIHTDLEPVLILEDIEASSIRAWLRQKISDVDDETLKSGDYKKVIGYYLVKAKYFIVDFTKDKSQITDKKEIKDLSDKLLGIAKETNLQRIPAYTPIQTPSILENIGNINKALSHLSPDDEVNFKTKELTTKFNLEFNFSPETIEELMTKETIANTNQMILKVKKPDYLGESMWELKHDTKSFLAKILHTEWLKSFQSREIDVRPGDSLRVQLEIIVKYGYDGEVVSMHYNVLNVIEVLPIIIDNQIGMFPESTE